MPSVIVIGKREGGSEAARDVVAGDDEATLAIEPVTLRGAGARAPRFQPVMRTASIGDETAIPLVDLDKRVSM